MAHRIVTYVPAFHKIFDEIFINAADNKWRDPSLNALHVDINVPMCTVSIYNNGEGIPIIIHKVERVYVPQFIFDDLMSGSTFDDGENRTTRGSNGYSAKLTNIYSTEFMIETSNGSGKMYSHVRCEG